MNKIKKQRPLRKMYQSRLAEVENELSKKKIKYDLANGKGVIQVSYTVAPKVCKIVAKYFKKCINSPLIGSRR